MAKRVAKTRLPILAAATATFVRGGYGNARVDRIAADAGVSKRMIYHFFQSKRGLYDAVMADDHLQTLEPATRKRLLGWRRLESTEESKSEVVPWVKNRRDEIARLQASQQVRPDVEPTYVALFDYFVEHLELTIDLQVNELDVSREKAKRVLTRLMRPRLRVNPNVVVSQRNDAR